MLLRLVRDAGAAVRLLIETKHPTRYGGLVEKELVELLARFGWAGRARRQPAQPATDSRVIVMSFAPTALRRVRLLAPDVPTVLLLERACCPCAATASCRPACRSPAPACTLLRSDPDFVERAHTPGQPGLRAGRSTSPSDVGLRAAPRRRRRSSPTVPREVAGRSSSRSTA